VAKEPPRSPISRSIGTKKAYFFEGFNFLES